MLSVNLYEEKLSTIVEDAMRCGKAAGVVSSKPILHGTPGAFISHTNNRKQVDQMRRSFREVNPTFASGTCARELYPFPEDLQSMRDGPFSRTWTFFEQKPDVLAEVSSRIELHIMCEKGVLRLSLQNFYDGLEALDPDNDDHVVVCMGGDFSPSNKEELPYRGVDSSYSRRRCGKGEVINAPNSSIPIGVKSNTRLCDRYDPEELKHIPHISKNVKAALDFLSKDDDGFFLMYEQGDVRSGLVKHAHWAPDL